MYRAYVFHLYFIKTYYRAAVFSIVGICLAITNVIVVVWSYKQISMADQARQHYSSVIQQAHLIRNINAEAENNLRSYVLTSNEDFHQGYHVVYRIKPEIMVLEKMIHSQVGKEHFEKLFQILTAKLEYMEKVVNLTSNNQGVAGLELLKTGRGFYLTEVFQKELQSFIELQQSLLDANEQKFLNRFSYFFKIAIYSSIFASFSALFAGYLFYRESRLKLKNAVSKRTEELLRIQKKVNLQLKLANLNLENNKEQLNVTLHSIGDGVITTDVNGNITRMNESAEIMTGWKSHEGLGEHFDMVFTLVSAQSNEPAFSPVQATLAQHTSIKIARDILLISKDNIRRDISYTCAPIFSADNFVHGTVIVFKDITAQEIARNRLRASEQIFRATFENASVGITHVARNGQIMAANDWFCRITGHTHEEVITHTFQDITHPEDLAADMEMYERILAGEIDHYQMEKRYLRKDQTSVWIDLSVSCIRDIQGEVDYFIAIVVDISERKKAQAESMRFFALSQELLCIANYEGHFVAVNQTWENTFGYSTSDMIVKPYLEFVHPADRAATARAVREVLRKGALSGFENRYIGSNGEIKHLLWSITCDKENRLLYCSARDITERKAYEKTLLLRTNQFQTFLDAAPVGIYVVDSTLTITHNNLAAALAFGQTTPLQGMKLPEILSNVMMQNEVYETIDKFNHTMASGQAHYENNFIYHKYTDKTVSYWDWQVNRIALSDKDNGVVCFFQDVTERVINQQKIIDTEKRFRTLFDRGPVAMYFCDTEGRILEYNDYAVKVWQLEPLPNELHDAFASRLKCYMPNGDPIPFNQSYLQKVLKGEVPSISDEEMVIERPNGTRFNVVINIVPIKNADGNIIGAMNCFFDMTERVKAEEALLQYTYELKAAKAAAEKANAAKSEFLSSMSHELRTPLNAILGFAQLMESAKPTVAPTPTPNQLYSIKQILHAGWYLLDLINEILELAQIESGKRHFSLEPVLLNEVISESVLLVESLCAKHEVTVHMSPLRADTYVLSDKTRLKQILLNLLSNAIKYNRKQGTVTIDFSVKKDMVKINVRDTGNGLNAEQLKHLFEPFNRLGQDNKIEDGTGIGLVVSKKLVELMHGTIGVRSKVGEGSVFWFSLKSVNKNALPLPPLLEAKYKLSKNDGNKSLIERRILLNADTHTPASQSHQTDQTHQAPEVQPADSGEDMPETSHPSSLSQQVPALASAATEDPPQQAVSNAIEAPTYRLLYIEDSETNLTLIEKVIAQRSDISLKCAKEGQEGLKLAREWFPDVILLDINLIGMNGYEVLESLNKHAMTAHIPVIAISANAMAADIHKGMRAGFFKYLTKPIKLDELMETLESAIYYAKHMTEHPVSQ